MISIVQVMGENKKTTVGVGGVAGAGYMGRGGLSKQDAENKFWSGDNQSMDKLNKLSKKFQGDQKAGVSDDWSAGNIAKRAKQGYDKLTGND